MVSAAPASGRISVGLELRGCCPTCLVRPWGGKDRGYRLASRMGSGLASRHMKGESFTASKNIQALREAVSDSENPDTRASRIQRMKQLIY